MTRIRKQDYDLTVDDLMQFPAWEYALDEETVRGQDERTVRPFTTSPPVDPCKAYLIVRASFRLADGTEMTGYVKPVVPDRSGSMSIVVPYDLHPIVVTDQGRVHFFHGPSKPTPEQTALYYRLLGKEAAEVFPIGFTSDVEVTGAIAEGTLEGFLYIDENALDFIHLKPTEVKVVR